MSQELRPPRTTTEYKYVAQQYNDYLPLVSRTRHVVLTAILAVLVLASTWASIGLTNFYIAVYAGLVAYTILLLGHMIGMPIRGGTGGRDPRTGVSYFYAHTSDAGLLYGYSVVGLIAAGVPLAFVAYTLAGCPTLYTPSNLCTFVFNTTDAGECTTSLTTLRSRPYFATSLDMYQLCQDDYAVSISFAVVVAALFVTIVVCVIHTYRIDEDTRRLHRVINPAAFMTARKEMAARQRTTTSLLLQEKLEGETKIM